MKSVRADQVQQILARREHTHLRQHHCDVCQGKARYILIYLSINSSYCQAPRGAAVDCAHIHCHSRAEPRRHARAHTISVHGVGWSRTARAELVLESPLLGGQLQRRWGMWRGASGGTFELIVCTGTNMRALQCRDWSFGNILCCTSHHSWNERSRGTTQLTAHGQHCTDSTWYATATARYGAD